MAIDGGIDVSIKEKVTGEWRKVTLESILSFNI